MRNRKRNPLGFERLETRDCPSAGPLHPIPHYAPPHLGLEGWQLHNYYHTPAAANGAGETIAIVDNGTLPQAQLDAIVGLFDARNKLPPVPGGVRQVYYDGTPPSAVTVNWAPELVLDVCAAHAAAPQARIVVAETYGTAAFEMYGAATWVATKYRADVVSMSWGAPSFFDSQTFDPYARTLFVASTGDTAHQVNGPASDFSVLAVGATETYLNARGGRSSETMWAGSSGGKTPGEFTFGFGPDRPSRVIPDLVAGGGRTAALHVPLPQTDGSLKWFHVYGTSESAPWVAGLMADLMGLSHTRWNAADWRSWAKRHPQDFYPVHALAPDNAPGEGSMDMSLLVRDLAHGMLPVPQHAPAPVITVNPPMF